jgi:hypothetical protein
MSKDSAVVSSFAADPGLHELREVLSKYSHHEVSAPFYGLVTHLPATHVNVMAEMRGDTGQRVDTADNYRMDTLSRVHEMIADLEDHLWVRTDAVSIEFRGALVEHALSTLDMKLIRSPLEGKIGCRVRLELDRMAGRL